MRKKWLLWSLACAGILCAVWGIFSLFGKRKTETVRWSPWKIEETEQERCFRFRGLMESRQKIPVVAHTNGRILWLRPQGSHVKKGDLLFTIDDTTAKETIESQEDEVFTKDLEIERRHLEYDVQVTRQENLVNQNRSKLDYARMELAEEEKKPLPHERRLMEIEEEIAALDLADAQEAYDRQYGMYQKQFITKSALESYEQSLANAKATLEEIRLKNQITRKGITEERRVELKKAVERAETVLAHSETLRTARLDNVLARIHYGELERKKIRAVIAHAQEEISQASVYAPADGVYLIKTYYDWNSGGVMREQKEGDEKNRNDIMGHITNLTGMQVNFVVNEADAMRLSPGMEVEVQLPALPGVVCRGTLQRVGAYGRDRSKADPAAAGTGNSEVMVFAASLVLQDDREDFHPGMSAEILVHAEKEKGIFIPRNFVFQEGEQNYVWADQGRTKVPVQGKVFNEMMFRVEGGLGPDISRIYRPEVVSGDGERKE